MRGWIAGAALLLVVAAGVTVALIALGREEARRQAWWRETKPSCRLLTVVSGRAFGPPQAVYECPGGLLVKRNIGD